MKDSIYYPYFEVHNKKWLKFALLYMDTFYSIIPPTGEKTLSDDFKKICDNTDLIKKHIPTYNETEITSIKVEEIIDNILSKPKRGIASYFNHGIGDISEKWRESKKWNFTIYAEKFPANWDEYLIEKNMGKRVSEGLLVNNDIGIIYLTQLANVIAEDKETSIISDSTDYENYLRHFYLKDVGFVKKAKVLEHIVHFKVPENIANIELSKLMDFRNRNKSNIESLWKILNDHWEDLKTGNRDESSLKLLSDVNKIISTFGDNISDFKFNAIKIPFKVLLALTRPDNLLEVFKELFEGTLDTSKAFYDLNNSLVSVNDISNTNKYFTNLEFLK